MHTVLCDSNSRDFTNTANIVKSKNLPIPLYCFDFSESFFKFLVRFSLMTLGKSNENHNWHVFTVSILAFLDSLFLHL